MTCISQMPTLKMKRKSSTACVKGHSLHSCQKSTKVSKVSFCEVKAFQQSVLLNDSSQSHDVSSNIEELGLNVDIDEANDSYDKSCGASPELLNLSSSLPSDPYPSGQVESLSVTCQSDLKTIFSPNFEYDDALIKMTNHSDAVRDEQTELPHLIADDSEDGSCTSSDFQSYSELDFYISENAAASSLDFINSICPDFDSMNSNMMMDMTERYMFLPFLEKTVETSIHDEDWVNGAIASSDDACLYLAIHHSDQEEMDCIELSEAVSSICPIWLPKEAREKKHITLVLDLDETLVHSTLEHCTDADFTFPVFFDMKQHTVYVRRRPYLQMFLERVAQLFKVIIFTASQSIYAEQLLDILDPCRNLISQRIYRESCIFSDGTYTKDLTILGVDLAKVAIIDNSPQVFRLQVNNGIPIKSWFDDPSDCALVSLLPFLESLADAEDVRPIISEAFGGKE